MNRSRNSGAWPVEITDVEFKAAAQADCARGLLGWASFLLNGRVRVDGVAVRKAVAGGMYLSFPARRDAHGRKRYFIHPVNNSARCEIERQVLAALGFEVRA